MTTDTAERDLQIVADQARENLALRRELADLRGRHEAVVTNAFARRVCQEYAANSGNNFREHFNTAAAVQWMRQALESSLATRNEARIGHKDCTVPPYLAVGTVLPGCDPRPVIAEGDGE